jgi:hypothetical protein
MMRKLVFLAMAPLTLLAACGGGGSGSFTPPPPPPPTQTIANPGPPNVETLVVNGGPVQVLNTAFINGVTICVHGTNTCQVVDNIEVDTGSSGLRLLSEAIPGLQLGIVTTNGGMTVSECLPFADGTSYGPVAVADVTFHDSGKTVSGLVIHVIGDPPYANIPSTCAGTPENTVAAFGANGILGVGPFLQDCGAACENEPANGITGAYYTCPTPSTCVDASVLVAQQVANPVPLFTGDNNGAIVELPAASNSGNATLTGALVFGIGTGHQNDMTGSETVLFENGSGFITANYKGVNYPQGYIDSGSNINFLDDNTLTVCADDAQFYCPNSAQNLSAILTGTSGSATANFTVANADPFIQVPVTLFAVPVLGGPSLDPQHQSFDLGLPYFYGHNIFQGIEGQTTSAGTGPFFAF